MGGLSILSQVRQIEATSGLTFHLNAAPFGKAIRPLIDLESMYASRALDIMLGIIRLPPSGEQFVPYEAFLRFTYA